MPESAAGFLTPTTSRLAMQRRYCQLGGAALLAAILVACGGSSSDNKGEGGNTGGEPGTEVPVDTLASFKQQTLNWQACDASTMKHQDDQKELAQLGARAQCALMRVPLDYANPSSAELQIEVLKVAAQQPQRKLGAIVFNPGGPGEDALSSATSAGTKMAQADPDEAGDWLQEMSGRYDLVAFSPRGIGRHSPLNCELTEEPPLPTNFNADSSAENVGKIQRYAQRLAQACAANPMSRHIHTEATARDMDLLRGLLNEEKLNYIGYSYGAWLGAWYAGLFPERVGRMLFDSGVDIASSFDTLMYAQIPASARLIDELLLPYAISQPAKFGLGSDLAALRLRLLALSAPLKSALATVWDFEGLDSDIYAISAAFGLQDLLAKKPQASWSEMNAAIADSPRFANPQVAHQARMLVARLFSPLAVEERSKESFVYWSVRCNDTGTTGSEQFWVDRAKDALARYPFSEVSLVENPCLYWNTEVRKMPAAQQMRTDAPVLLLQSEYDPLTPMDGARRNLAALPDARLIVVEKAHEHGLFPYGTACVDSHVARYFIDGKLPLEKISSCAGKEAGADEDKDEEDA